MNRYHRVLDHPAALILISLSLLVVIEVLRFTHLIRIP